MTLNVLFSALPHRWSEYQLPLVDAFETAGLDINLARALNPADVDYIVYAPNGPVTDFGIFPRLKAVLGLWAGVEKITGNETLKVSLTRMVDSGLSEGMVEWVTGHVLRYHLGMDKHILANDGKWLPLIPPLARQRSVGILGLGELGTACASALAGLNFNVSGWARSPKTLENVACFHGTAGLSKILQQSDILVLLLPLTPATENIINAEGLAEMQKGAFLINPGRGALIDDDDLLAALDSDHIAGATLDVFRQEPLPPDHRYWHHPKVTVTPHIASETRPDTAAQIIAENVRLFEAGEPMKFVVDRSAGY